MAVDLVRGEVQDSSVATQCWAHASGCPSCADFLLAQEKLTAGLEALAADSERVPVPERIESVLRHEFRLAVQRNGRAPVAQISAARPLRPVGAAGSRLAWAMALAASVLIATAIAVSKWRGSAGAPQIAQSTGADQQVTADSGKRAGTQPKAGGETAQPPVTKKASSSGMKHAPPSGKTSTKPRPRAPVRSNPDDLVASDFIWLPYGSGVPLDDGWAMIRVTMPRSELASLGVAPLDFPGGPLNNGTASAQMLKADVVLGPDGMARAIRFVE